MHDVEGDVAGGNLDKDEELALKPRMIGVNNLVEQIRAIAKRNFDESDQALDGLYKVLRDKLGVAYKLEPKVKPKDSPTPGRSGGLSNPPG